MRFRGQPGLPSKIYLKRGAGRKGDRGEKAGEEQRKGGIPEIRKKSNMFLG